jgi:hypothetical protein
MNITYQSSIQGEFTILALIARWESIGTVSALQFATANNVDIVTWWDFYRAYKIMNRGEK